MNLANTIHSLRQLPPDQVLAKATQVLPPWVTLVLVVAVAWKVAQLTWLVWPAAADLPLAAIPEPATGSAPSAVAGGVDIASVARAHLFGQPPAAAPPVQRTDVEGLEEYAGRLELSGTIAADDPKDARAIISDPGGDEKVYAIKEAVPDGSTISFELRILKDNHINFQLARDTTKHLTALYLGFVGGNIQAYGVGGFNLFTALLTIAATQV